MVTLTNVGANYDDAGCPASQGLGIVFLDFTGALSIDYAFRVNRIGTGTQSWQLWNETDSAEVGVIADAAAGVKTLSGNWDVSSKGWTGKKRCRVRAKSTTAADDPVYHGATFWVNRT